MRNERKKLKDVRGCEFAIDILPAAACLFLALLRAVSKASCESWMVPFMSAMVRNLVMPPMLLTTPVDIDC